MTYNEQKAPNKGAFCSRDRVRFFWGSALPARAFTSDVCNDAQGNDAQDSDDKPHMYDGSNGGPLRQYGFLLLALIL